MDFSTARFSRAQDFYNTNRLWANNALEEAMVDLGRDADDAGVRPSLGLVGATHARVPYERLPRDPAAETPDQRRWVSPGISAGSSGERVASVDAVRGLAMFFIIAGDPLAWALYDLSPERQGLLSVVVGFFSDQLMHVDWEGFHFYDFLFSLFVFITGVSIVLSLPRLVEREGKWAAHERVLRRSFLLFALGLIYYGGLSTFWPEIRLLGVLQRIALCYLFASLLFLNLGTRGLVVALVSLLVGYWALMTFVPVPGIGAGMFAEDANLARWIDAQYLPGKRYYGAYDYDPEGLLSTLPAIASCLLGVFAGLLLKSTRTGPLQKVLWLVGVGAILVAAGHLWGLEFPVIKKIWTSSFVLVAGGYSALLLGALYLVIDIWGRKAWATIFVWFGANAIALYMINNVADFQGLARRLVGGDVTVFLDARLASGMGSLVTVAVGIALATVLARYLYHRKIFLRV
jgi:predicted acyltransferase